MEDCDACKLVLCGSNKCREEHREQHNCKERAEELHDNDLFTQPDSSFLGECPLCFLPMPLDPEKYRFMPCCSNLICNGCDYAHEKSNGGDKCPFCREPEADDEGHIKRMMKRVKANDPAAMCFIGMKHYLEYDNDTAIEYLTKAAELGDLDAHYQLALLYRDGEGVEKDDEKEVYHSEKAAIGGHPDARHNLACIEHKNGRTERAVKHFIIAANLGYEDSMKNLWKYYANGYITKEDLEATLYTHQAAIDEMKSTQRKAAEKARS
jgi:tetratricopeptide (TPR) repeat protein